MKSAQVGDRNGRYEIVAVIPDKVHSHVQYVSAKKVEVDPHGEKDEYCTWLYNKQSQSFAHGHYGMTRDEAIKDMVSRSSYGD